MTGGCRTGEEEENSEEKEDRGKRKEEESEGEEGAHPLPQQPPTMLTNPSLHARRRQHHGTRIASAH
eukprot:3360933-Rhodomonas_salina.7